MQGVQITQGKNQGTFEGILIPTVKPDVNVRRVDGDEMTNEEILNVIKSKLPNDDTLVGTIKSVLDNYTVEFNRIGKKRSYRSLDAQKGNEQETSTFGEIGNFSTFMNDLKKYNIWETVEDLIRKNSSDVTIFCPTDEKYQEFLNSNKHSPQELKKTLVHHIATQFGKHSMTYRSLLNNKILSMVQNGETGTLKVENAKVKLTINFSSNVTLHVIDGVLESGRSSLMEVLMRSNGFSMMTKLFLRSPLKKLLHSVKCVKQICFERSLCLPVVGKLKQHFKNLMRTRQFTIQVLDDEAFGVLTKTTFEMLLTDEAARKDFLLQHVFLGMLDHDVISSATRMIAASAKKNHPITEMLWDNGRPVVAHPDTSIYYRVYTVVRVKEGLVQMLKPMK